MKLKALLVVRRIVSWQILRMDKCVYVVYSFYTRVDVCTRVYTSGLMPRMFFAFAHAAHTRHTRVTHVCRLSCGWFVRYVWWWISPILSSQHFGCLIYVTNPGVHTKCSLYEYKNYVVNNLLWFSIFINIPYRKEKVVQGCDKIVARLQWTRWWTRF